MKLIDCKTGKQINIGDKAVTFRQEHVIVRGFTPPHTSGSTGRVEVMFNDGSLMSYFPAVIDAIIVPD